MGAGFDVFGMALSPRFELGGGAPPEDGHVLEPTHPAAVAYRTDGGTGELWARSQIPIGRGLGYSGAARVAGVALAMTERDDDPLQERDRLVDVATRLEGHADNVAASVWGGVTAVVGGRSVALGVGPVLAAGRIAMWVPASSTSTARSRAELPDTVRFTDAVGTIAAAIQMTLAIEHDDPDLLAGATDDLLHQPTRLARRSDAANALAAGVAGGAWCGWLSGSGPAVALWCADGVVADVVDALAAVEPTRSHVKVVTLDLDGVRIA
jgi:homoserine kinase